MKKISLWKKIILAVVAVIVIFLLVNIKLVIYGVQQGLGQLEMVRNAVPISDLLSDKNYPDSLKQKLLIINEVRRFAMDSLGLKNSENYNAVYDLKGRATAYVVQAAEKYRVKNTFGNFRLSVAFRTKAILMRLMLKKKRKVLNNKAMMLGL